LRHFIFDFETIGADANICPVLECSYFTFDSERFATNPYTFNELTQTIVKIKFDLEHQRSEHKLTFAAEDLEFWKKQGKNAMKKFLPSDEDHTLSEFIDKLIQYVNVTKPKYWWSRSNTFDPVILWRLARYTDNTKALNKALPYNKVRDVRTYIDAKFNFTTENGFCPFPDETKWGTVFQAHNSIHDVAADILRIQTISRAELDLELLNE
jgi:hypothetical protein